MNYLMTRISINSVMLCDVYGKTSFKGLKQRVILRHTGATPANVPQNVLMQSWLPQNDLIAHPNTRLFITHCGNNGQLEGVYHGVPMLMMPLFGDQETNANRGVRRKYGLKMSAHEFTVEEFKGNVLELLNNRVYRDSIQKCSRILHSLPSAQSKAVFWIEHVLEFGGDHLRPYFMEMPLWKFFGLDVLFVCVITGSCLLAGVWWCCVKCCCRRRVKTKTE